ncbi:MAG: multidrug efflux SMR transporter [Alcanivorax sp.]|jgi:quaternary ammonium compound-resistance protein SugE|nr:multidrug efflux SMR transporter [Alcanivorax sp.]HIK75153.1 multidrug efflux SMR transporter [Alcanivorax sp.]
MNPYWWVLLAAVVVEIAWAMSLKWIQLQPGLASISTSLVLTALNMLALSFAMRGIPVGTAYAVWTGLGAVGITLLGVIVFDDPLGAARLGFLALIIVGVVGLKLSTQGG